MSKSLYDLIENDASVEEIKAAIAEGADVNEIKAYRPVLLLAVERKKGADVVRALLEAGAEVDRYITKDDLTDEDKETMEEEGIGLYDCVGITQWTPLHSAIYDNDLEVAKLLLEAGADVNLKTGHDEGETCTPLGHARTKESIELLIKYGADVHQEYGLEGYDDEGNPYSQDINTKLHWDLHRLDPECVLLLLRAGATTWEIDEYIEMHPEVDADVFRSLAEENNNSSQDDDWEDDDDQEDDDDWGFDNYSDDETEDEEEENDEEEEAKSKSIFELLNKFAPTTEEIKAALAEGVDINAKDGCGNPLIIKVAEKGLIDVCKELIEAGADIHVCGYSGSTLISALMNSYDDGGMELAIKLIKAGVDINYKAWDGETYLDYAVEKGSKEAIEALIEAGADITERDTLLHTAVESAAYLEDVIQSGAGLEMIQYLIDKGLDVNKRDEEGRTLLHKTVLNNSSDAKENIVQYLIDKGLNINERDVHGRSPIFYAGSPKQLEVIMKVGPHVNIIDCEGCTCSGKIIRNLGEQRYEDMISERGVKRLMTLLEAGAVAIVDNNEVLSKEIDKFARKNPTADKKLIRKLLKENMKKFDPESCKPSEKDLKAYKAYLAKLFKR